MHIPKISDFLPCELKKYVALRLVISISLGAGFLGWYISIVQGYSFISMTWPFFTAFVCYKCTGIGIDEYRYNQAKRVFKEKLPDADYSLLVKITASPEMTNDERDVIIGYLNKNCPGWSLTKTTSD